MQTYLLDRLSIAFESLTVASDIAIELVRDKVLDEALAERLKSAAAEVALVYVAIPRQDEAPTRVPGTLS